MSAVEIPDVESLNDKYLRTGRVFLSGTQALCRLPLLQREIDRAAGLNTAGYISGYRGSPLGTYDQQLQRISGLLASHHVVFQPGINEELAATAAWGSQQVGLRNDSDYDGVFAIWYGKGPGVDRSGDALRHANLAGTARHGGVLALVGDDHTCESSTTCHQSEFALVDAMIPLLNPAGVQEILEFGLYGIAMSRYSGCWIGIKCVHDTVSSTASVTVDPDQMRIRVPADFGMPPDGLNIRIPDLPREQESRLHRYKLQAAQAFAYSNRLDRVVWDCPRPRIGIVSTGKSWLDVVQALADLGIDRRKADQLGLRSYKVALPWPLEPKRALEVCSGLDLVIVVEEKRALVESQLKELFYGRTAAPEIVGKRDLDGNELLRTELDLDSNQVAVAIGRSVLRLVHDAEIEVALKGLLPRSRKLPDAEVVRTPYFCAGCPHSSSTRIPEGSRAIAGIGCSWMSQFMDRGVSGYTQMGGEGASWIGEAPFSKTSHVFQNLGDGTYFHSGLLAIRAAVASGRNITYKILYNDAVAMTGGQQHDGELSAWMISHQVHAEGVRAIALVTDDPGKYPATVRWAPGVTLHHRSELNAVQTKLAATAGTTVLIYDQTCAAEKRRRRKRKLEIDPPKRLFIDERVCEGCGDCGMASNCVAIVPRETDYGTKRAVDQSACNKDFSCLGGFCPSFVTVLGGKLRRTTLDLPASQPPEPIVPGIQSGYGILIGGIGGTGVVTIGALIGMAAHLEGKGCAVLDMTGMAQKGGAVVSHVRLASSPTGISAVRIAPGSANLILGCDLVVTASSDTLKAVNQGVTRAIVNTHPFMTGEFTRRVDYRLPSAALMDRIVETVGAGQVTFVEATKTGVDYFGDSIAANMVMLGYAYQLGLLPVGAVSIERAIDLNGVDPDMNKGAFRLGRHLAAKQLSPAGVPDGPAIPVGGRREELLRVIADRSRQLSGYQDEAYAVRYASLVDKVGQAEVRVGGDFRLALSAARCYAKLLMYKDEYEVARLFSAPDFTDRVNAQFEGEFKLRFNLAPPLLSKRDPVTGTPLKREFGSWILFAFRWLSRLRFLRGTPLDPFGLTKDRVAERKLIREYESLVDLVVSKLCRENLLIAHELLALPESIRGYGHVKLRNIGESKKREAQLRDRFLEATDGVSIASQQPRVA